MRFVVISGLLALTAGAALAQSPPQTKAVPTAGVTRYFTSLNDVMDGDADIILKETRQAGKITAASLDVCYPSSQNSDIKERFAVDLTVNGQSLTGTTETMRGKLPVSVNLTQRGSQGKYEFNGRITTGGTATDVSSTENSDLSEQEFKDDTAPDDNIVSAPKDFTEVSPESLAARVKIDAVADFLKTLRGESVELSVDSFTATCAEMRSGEQVIYMSVNPENAAATLAKLKTAPGVVDAGWTDGSFEIDRTLRFTSAPWMTDGKLNRDKLASAISDVLAKTLSAKSSSFKWNDESGELTLTVKRPFATLPDLGLTDSMDFTVLVAPDRPGSTDRLILWLSSPVITTTDESSGPHLNLSNATSTDDDSGETDDGGSIGALAQALKAQRWDSSKSAWQ